MIQVENINNIEYIRGILKELEKYHVDISKYFSFLEKIVHKYEYEQKNEILVESDNGIQLMFGPDAELELSINLNKLKDELFYYIMFLDLIHSTNDWSLDIEVNDVFYKVSNSFDTLLDKFYQIDIQKMIIGKYHDLLLKKILKDYKNNDLELIDKYDDLKGQVYLVDSIKRYLDSSNKCLDSEIVNYNLRDLITKIFKDDIVEVKEEVLVVSDKKEKISLLDRLPSFDLFSRKNKEIFLNYSYPFVEDKNIMALYEKYPDVDFDWLGSSALEVVRFFKFEQLMIERIKNKDFSFCDLRGLDLSGVNFDGVKVNNAKFKGTKAKINPQTVYDKDLSNGDFEGLDFSKANFDDVIVNHGNFRGTKAKINPQKVWDRDLSSGDFEGLDFSKANFDDVKVNDAKFKGTNAKINPQTVYDKDLSYGNYEGLDFSEADFDDVKVHGAKFKGTNAYINPRVVYHKDLSYGDYEGLDFSKANFDDVEVSHANFKGTNAKIDPQGVYHKDLSYGNYEGLDFSEADFDDVKVHGAKFKGTNAYINPQMVYGRNLGRCDLEDVDLSKANFDSVNIVHTNLRNTNAHLSDDFSWVLYGYPDDLRGCYVDISEKNAADKTKLERLGATLLSSKKLKRDPYLSWKDQEQCEFEAKQMKLSRVMRNVPW